MSNLISKKHVEKTGVGNIRHSQRRTYRLKDNFILRKIGGGNQSIHRKPPLLSYIQQNQDTPRI
jgi:hypothetical protein